MTAPAACILLLGACVAFVIAMTTRRKALFFLAVVVYVYVLVAYYAIEHLPASAS